MENLFVSNKLNDFQGKRALVTGAGDGIGEMLAKNLAGAGLSVVVQDIRLDAAERVAQEIGDAATPIAFDVSDREACMIAAETIANDGPMNLLWVNAGVGVGASILKGRPNAIEWAVGVNVLGVVWTTQAFVPLMASATGPRHVGFTASSAALRKAEGSHP
ncbi:MAG: SDR family NAD(P)-dependent oxidoreductase, partial [Gammaproteobacteria bacterium]|nr:SDR family NAD(P)-dependent oxidoreductase [Gammaproteobacteria bacterium]